MLDLQKLKTFRMVAATNSFTRAAAELGYSQSSVTTQIKALERELGAPLFDRFAKKVALTEVGQKTLEYAGRLLALADETKAAVRKQGKPAGPLKVSAPEALLIYRLPDLLRQFQIEYPLVHLDLSSGGDPRAQASAVLDGAVDVAFVAGEVVQSDRLNVEHIAEEDILFVVAPQHSLAKAEAVTWDHLSRVQVLLTGRGCGYRAVFEQALDLAPVRLSGALELTSIEAVKQCAIAGMGVAVLPRTAIVHELEQRKLVPVRWTGTPLVAYTQMVRHRERWMTPALEGLWMLAEKYFGVAIMPPPALAGAPG
ncbi:MAG TPA: LysR family transcriptional regulator [Bryobacteraceae bacterium]|nr:LysR family transcriptional regulator [Bryobacteraceae bacterium]